MHTSQSHRNTPAYFHLIARAIAPLAPFRDFATARKTWHHLQRLFPNAIGCVLMPNHLHLLTPLPNQSANVSQADVTLLKRYLGSALCYPTPSLPHLYPPGALTPDHTWERLPEPKLIADHQHLRRTWRYIMLNPNRWRLISDPMCWIWSTYRDLFGAAYPQWISNRTLAGALREPMSGLAERLHSYVTRDETTAAHDQMEGTIMPHPVIRHLQPIESPEHLLAALCAALRVEPVHAVSKTSLRRAFARLALRQGWSGRNFGAALARTFGVHPRTMRRALELAGERATEDALVAAAAVCLSDARLTMPMHPLFAPHPSSLSLTRDKTPVPTAKG